MQSTCNPLSRSPLSLTKPELEVWDCLARLSWEQAYFVVLANLISCSFSYTVGPKAQVSKHDPRII